MAAPKKSKVIDAIKLYHIYKTTGRTVVEQVATSLQKGEEFSKFEAWAKLNMLHYANLEMGFLDENIPLEKKIQWGRDLVNMIEGSKVVLEDKSSRDAPKTERDLAIAVSEKMKELAKLYREVDKTTPSEALTDALDTTFDA